MRTRGVRGASAPLPAMRPRPHAPYTRPAVACARERRREAPFAQRLLWSRLRRRALGVAFRRQQPVGPFVVDFFAPAVALAVDVDGRGPGDRGAAVVREAALRSLGVRVLRVTNDEVRADLDGVVARIAAALNPSP